MFCNLSLVSEVWKPKMSTQAMALSHDLGLNSCPQTAVRGSWLGRHSSATNCPPRLIGKIPQGSVPRIVHSVGASWLWENMSLIAAKSQTWKSCIIVLKTVLPWEQVIYNFQILHSVKNFFFFFFNSLTGLFPHGASRKYRRELKMQIIFPWCLQSLDRCQLTGSAKPAQK